MKRTIISTLVFCLIMMAGSPAAELSAQEGLGGVPGSYLFMGVGARALGLGGAFSAIADDATATYWNPAGLAAANPFQLSFMHAVLFLDTSFDFFAASVPTKSVGNFGAAFMALSSGGFEQRNVLNEVVGEFSTRDMAFLLSWSTELSRRFSVGVTYKLVNQSILSQSGTGHGIDLGLKSHLSDYLSAGLVLRNIVRPKVTSGESTQEFPTQIGAGISAVVLNEQLLLSAEYSKINGWGDPELHMGAEFRFANQAAIRIGMSDQNATFGLGFALDNLGVGYSNIGSSELGSSHRFSLDYAFGGFHVGAEATPRIFSPAGEFNITRIDLKVKSRSAIADWSFVILDSKGEVVHSFRNAGSPPAEIVWDGRNAKGTLAADGDFRYIFEVNTSAGKYMTSRGKLVTIDSSGPKGTIAATEE